MGKSKQPTRKEKRLRGPSPVRARRIARDLVAGMSQREALKRAGYSRSTAENNPQQVVRTPSVAAAIKDALVRAGIDENSIAAVVRDAMNATRLEFARREGKITDAVETVDHQTRLKSVELAATLHDAVPHKQRDGDSGPRFVINLPAQHAQILFAGPGEGTEEMRQLMATPRASLPQVIATALTEGAGEDPQQGKRQ